MYYTGDESLLIKQPWKSRGLACSWPRDYYGGTHWSEDLIVRLFDISFSHSEIPRPPSHGTASRRVVTRMTSFASSLLHGVCVSPPGGLHLPIWAVWRVFWSGPGASDSCRSLPLPCGTGPTGRRCFPKLYLLKPIPCSQTLFYRQEALRT